MFFFCQKWQFSNGHKNSFIAPVDINFKNSFTATVHKFYILAKPTMENQNLKSTFLWDLLEILTLVN